jgi:aflatoxin B1 aldehyde reductase
VLPANRRCSDRGCRGRAAAAATPAYLTHNLAAVAEGPLPAAVLSVIDNAAETARPSWPEIAHTI